MMINMVMITVVLVIVGVLMLGMKAISQQIWTRLFPFTHRPRSRQRTVCRCTLHDLVGLTVHAAAMTQLNIMIVTTVVNYTISTFHQSTQFRFYFVESNHDIDVKFLIGHGMYPYSGYSRPNTWKFEALFLSAQLNNFVILSMDFVVKYIPLIFMLLPSPQLSMLFTVRSFPLKWPAFVQLYPITGHSNMASVRTLEKGTLLVS